MLPLPWDQIDTVLLDMDGTLLDLHFDNHFWLEHLPARFAELRGLSRAEADAVLTPLFHAHAGQLTWYCLDFWSSELDLSIVELKQEVVHLIAPRAGVEDFLSALQATGKRVVLVTNAHRDSLALKMQRVPLEPYFERLVSSHDYGFPKEDQRFWATLQREMNFDPARALFIDDSLPILRSAGRFGIGHLLAVRNPDSRQAARDTEEFAAIEDYAALLPGLAPR
jgi:HAD superfamily hydrolase (TIGR01509 family)